MQLHRARAQFDQAGGRLVLIGQSTPREAANFRRRQGVQLQVLADEKRISYDAAGAKVGGMGDLFSLKVVTKGALTGLREKTVQGRTVGDARQLGGVLVIAPDGRVTWSHMAVDASDNASPEQIVEAIRAAGA
jgi:peroxiredoxin